MHDGFADGRVGLSWSPSHNFDWHLEFLDCRPKPSRALVIGTRSPLANDGELKLTELAQCNDALDPDAALAAFIHNAQERGFVRTTEIDAPQHEFDLDEDALAALRAALEDADIEVAKAVNP